MGLFLQFAIVAARADVQTVFDSTGLRSLRWQGDEFVRPATRNPVISFLNAGGTRYGSPAPTQTVIDVTQKAHIFTYSWGSLVLRYEPTLTRLNMRVSVTNNSADPIVECALGLLHMRFPSLPSGNTWQNGFELAELNTDEITALLADYGKGVMVACNDQPGRPLRFGFSTPLASNHYELRMSLTTNDCPDDPRIAPGETRQFDFSLRFGPKETDPESLIGDLHAALAAEFPHELVWEDRRAIGSIFLANHFHSSATNPRGWLSDPSINVFTPGGLTDFRQRMLAQADTCVSILQSMNAQGMIFWNVEGEEFPYITYAGDPRRLGDLAPEMDGVADQVFQKFRDAGLRTGVCLRPSRIVPGFPNTGHPWDHDNAGFDLLANLSDKVTYAKTRWGCSLFYIDSNVEWVVNNQGVTVSRLLRASLMRDLRRLHPDILIIPELPTTAYWQSTAPYREVLGGYTQTPARTRAVYPEAFTTIEPKDINFTAYEDALTAAVSAGDILLFRGWFGDSSNPFIRDIYQAAHPAPVITSAGAAQGDVGVAFQYGIAANNAPTSFAAAGLPPGLLADPQTGAISGTPTLSGAFAVTLSASSLWGTGQKPLTLQVRSLFDQWRAIYFPSSGTTGDAAAEADPEGDGLGNFLEFALGLNPSTIDPTDLRPRLQFVAAAGQTWPALTFRRRVGPIRGVDYVVLESINLSNWAPIDSTANQIGEPIALGDGTELITIRGNSPVTSNNRSFLRLSVTAP